MKQRMLLLPLTVSIAAVWLLVSQYRAISSVRESTSSLRKQIAASGEESASRASSVDSVTPGRTSPKTTINWLRIAELTGEYGGGGIFAKQELLRVKKRMHLMSPVELLASLATTKSLGLDARSLGEIDGMLIQSLGEKDPQAALDYLTVSGNDHIGLSTRITNSILADWTKKDFPAALAWFEGKIADGSFDSKSLGGRNHRRFNIEATFLANLSVSDPAAAVRRLAAYPEADRAYIFQQIAMFDRYVGKTTDENSLASRVMLARDTLSGPAQGAVIAKSITPFSEAGDYGKIDLFLERVAATPDERTASVAATAKERFEELSKDDRLTVQEVDRFREWATSQSPGKIDEITGRALAVLASNKGNGSDPTTRVNELVLHYQESTGNDDVLLGFLGSWAFWGDAAKARSLAERIRDPDQRARFLATLESNPFAR